MDRIGTSKLQILVLVATVASCSGGGPIDDSLAPVVVATTAAPVDESLSIDVLNVSDFDTDDTRYWADFASSKMANRRSNVLVFIYPIGENIGPEDWERFDKPFTSNEVLMTPSEIEELLNRIQTWMENDSCLSRDPRLRQEELVMYRSWLEGGADASSQLDLCRETRVVAMGVRNDQPIADYQHLLVHELYHAFQQDLANEPCRDSAERNPNSNSVWVVEGAADYFTYITVGELTGVSDPVGTMLGHAKQSIEGPGDTDVMGNAMATRSAAALRLMVERGSLSESSILDGTLFHDCARGTDFNSPDSEVDHAKDSWHLLERTGSTVTFTQAAFR
ncbi:MAG: hypothetical protein P8M16_07850 [Acidimicrobiales bacterium]|nr:hypothetical protein [Acidimicrobiales bacterium]